MINIYEDLMSQIDRGLNGMNGSIPFPISKLDYYIDIAKNMNYLFVGDTGAGKTALAHEIILGVLDWYYKNKNDDIKLTIIYFGMERKMYNYSAKWVSRRIFIDEGILIPIKKMLGRMRVRDEKGRLTDKYDLMTDEEIKLVKKYASVFKEWQNNGEFICFEGTHNPTGIKIFLDNFANEHGKMIARGEGPLDKPKYIPNHPNHIVLIVTDYVGVLDKEKSEDTKKKKDRLDLYSSVMRKCRDLYGFSPVNIQQLSRQLGDVTRIRLNDVRPKLNDIADTSDLARDADVVLAIFEPWRYLPQDTERDIIGYDLNKLRDKDGYKYYRSLHILKSSFDGDGIALGCAFHPQTGIIKPMPKPPDAMTDSDYQDITNGTYFIQ